MRTPGFLNIGVKRPRRSSHSLWVSAAMGTDPGAALVLSGSYVGTLLSHQDEGYGGAADRNALVARMKP